MTNNNKETQESNGEMTKTTNSIQTEDTPEPTILATDANISHPPSASNTAAPDTTPMDTETQETNANNMDIDTTIPPCSQLSQEATSQPEMTAEEDEDEVATLIDGQEPKEYSMKLQVKILKNFHGDDNDIFVKAELNVHESFRITDDRFNALWAAKHTSPTPPNPTTPAATIPSLPSHCKVTMGHWHDE